jgi:capsular exopolysaccharide synthesis family protein
MGNVWKAMKKHQAEADQAKPDVAPAGETQGDEAPPAPSPDAPQADTRDAVSPGPEAPPPPQPGPEAARTNAALQPVDGNGFAEELVAYHDRGGKITEEYRALRTSLLAQNPQERFSYVLTSAEPTEGKTVTTVNLGFVLTERPDRETVLVDFDLRKPRLARLLNGDREPGVADYLRGNAKVEDIIRPSVYPNLFYIPAGRVHHSEVGELIGRSEVETLVEQLRRTHDFVLFDSPPLNSVSDAGILGQVVGQVLLVVRMAKTRRESVEQAVRLLHAANVDLGGVVMTHRSRLLSNYYYYRYYRYGA